MDARDRLPKRLRKASPERIKAYQQETARKAASSCEECRVLFRLRMEREGKLDELTQRINEFRHLGKSRRQAVYAAMREMGYPGAGKERALHTQAQAHANVDRYLEVQKKATRRYRRKMRNEKLFEAMNRLKLKANAPAEAEMDWVAAHHKYLAALDQSRDAEAEPIKVTAEDIDEKTPSRSAVGRLMAAVKDPEGWQKKRLDADKGKTGAGQGEGDESEAIDESLNDVERMLRAASHDG